MLGRSGGGKGSKCLTFPFPSRSEAVRAVWPDGESKQAGRSRCVAVADSGANCSMHVHLYEHFSHALSGKLAELSSARPRSGPEYGRRGPWIHIVPGKAAARVGGARELRGEVSGARSVGQPARRSLSSLVRAS